jgi:hypothetical protein
MKKEIDRYTLNLVSNKAIIPFALSNLENIERMSTNFNNNKDMADFLSSYLMLKIPIEDFIITYNADKKPQKIFPYYRDQRSIVDDKMLINKIMTYLDKYSNVLTLDIESLDNRYLRKLLYDVLEQKTLNNYNFRLNIIKKQLEKEYKLKRDLATFLNEQREKKGQTPLIKVVNTESDYNEVLTCLNKMTPLFNTNIKTGDEYLDFLIANHNYEKIIENYDIETLYSLGITDIIYGNQELDKNKPNRR